jgi:uncharacterized protein with NAD-binding domain and iron-sulfur cluster
VKALRIAIVGYGTAGQASAALLARDGHELDVFEQAPSLGRLAPACCCSRPDWKSCGDSACCRRRCSTAR